MKTQTILEEKQARKEGYRPFAGPYFPREIEAAFKTANEAETPLRLAAVVKVQKRDRKTFHVWTKPKTKPAR